MKNKFKVGDKVRLRKDKICSLPKHLFDHDKVYTVVKSFTTYYDEDCIDVMGVETGGWYSWRFELAEENMKHTTIRCVIDQPYVDRPMAAKDFDWIIYNASTNYVVAVTYCEAMARAILQGIQSNPTFMDLYCVTKRWKSPEPMV